MTQAEFNLYMQTNSTRRPSRSGQSFSWSGRGFPLSTRGAVYLCSLVLSIGTLSSLIVMENFTQGMPATGEVVLVADAAAAPSRPHA